MSRGVVLVMVGTVALAVSGCGATAASQGATQTPASAASTVRHDLARITRAFPFWHLHTVRHAVMDSACPDTGGGAPAASLAGNYAPPIVSSFGSYSYPISDAYPSFLKVEVGVEYRSAANSQRFIAAFDKPSVLRCSKASEIAYWRSRKSLPAPKPPFPRVNVTASLPQWLTARLAGDTKGYLFTTVPFTHRGHAPLFYSLHFGFQDASDPHVAYYVIVYEVHPVKHQLETDASLARQASLRIIHATR